MNASPLDEVMVAPSTSPAVRMANPSATVSLAVATRATWLDRPAPRAKAAISGSSRRPLPIAFTPRIAWKNCGAANSRPNIAKMPNACRMVPQVNLADRNSPRSTSGSPPGRLARRSSHPAKAARTATPPTIARIAVGEDQPYCPAAMNP